jgi:hypothetical protein
MDDQSWWWECDEIKPMLSQVRRTLTRRKKRLLVVAAARRVEHLMRDIRSRQVLDAAERHADGMDEARALTAARAAAQEAQREASELSHSAWQELREQCEAAGLEWRVFVHHSPVVKNVKVRRSVAAARASSVDYHAATAAVLTGTASPSLNSVSADIEKALTFAERLANRPVNNLTFPAACEAALSDLVREVVGDPFREALIQPAWLACNGGVVPGLAQAIHDEKAFDRLAVLGDALEEAGCEDRALLEHLRRPGGHVRGCWALDAVLGKR